MILTAAALFCWIAVLPRLWYGRAAVPTKVTLMWYPAVIFTGCACLGWILINLGARIRDRATRCRQCGHILRGLSEPRCPECGEAI